jgi:hypothetical protein
MRTLGLGDLVLVFKPDTASTRSAARIVPG